MRVVLIALLLIPFLSFSQILQLHPSVGDTISKEEKVLNRLALYTADDVYEYGYFLKKGNEVLLIIKKPSKEQPDTLHSSSKEFEEYQQFIKRLRGEAVNVEKDKRSSQTPKIFTRKRNALFLELGGTALIYSLNYSFIVYRNSTLNIEPRIGVTFLPNIFGNGGQWCPVIGTDVIIGQKRHAFETGLGYLTDNTTNVTGFRLGYRYNSYSGFLFRIGNYSALLSDYKGSEFSAIIPYLVIGKTF